MEFWDIISLLTPVILLIALGKLLNHVGILTEQAVMTMKKLIVNVGLPAVMFLSFSEVHLESRYIFIVLGIFLLNLILLFAGIPAARWTGQKSDRFLFTGFEYGMLAYALFALVYGRANVPLIALIALGHELFIWFIYVPSIQNSVGEKASLPGILMGLAKSPIILGILLGLILNFLGVSEDFYALPVLSGVKETLETLGTLTGPLILLVLGAGLVFSRTGLNKALKVIALRLPLVGVLIYLVGYILFQQVLQLPIGFSVALAVLLLAPPPFVIPVFLPEEQDHSELNMVLALFTTVSLLLFLAVVVLFPRL